ncbi:MAG: hypothetical protein ACRC0L_09955 [Angustibacter sp.]
MAAKKAGAGKISARERARSAKAELDAQRAEREKKIEDAAANYYEAEDAIREADEARSLAQLRAAQAIAELIDVHDEPADRVAALCGLTVPKVRALRKQALKEAAAEVEDSPPAEPVTTDAAADSPVP